MNEEQRQQGMATLNPELRYVLEEKGVDADVMGMLGHFGITDNETFAGIAGDESSLRAMLKDDFDIDADGGIVSRVRAAKLINAWRTSRERIKKQTELDADARAEGRPKELPRQAQLTLRRAYEEIHGEVEDHLYPSNAYNNERVTQIEEGDFRAEALGQVVSYAEAGEEMSGEMGLTMTRSSTVKLVRSKLRVGSPKDIEELRMRYRIMSTHWELMKIKHPDRETFKHLTAQTWNDILEYLLGPKVYGYKSGRGVRLSWDDLLSYEFEIRKRAMRRVNAQGETIASALKEAKGNDELRSLFFTLQLVTSGTRPQAQPSNRDRSRSPKSSTREDAKGKGKDKGKRFKGKGKAKGSSWNDSGLTPAQHEAARLYNDLKKKGRIDWKHGKRNKCVRFNKLTCERGEHCENAHVCMGCGGSHAYPDCPKK